LTNFEKLKAEVERLKAQVKVMRQRQKLVSQSRQLISSERRIQKSLGQEKKRLKRELHPLRARFSDFVAMEFKKSRKKIPFNTAVRRAKEEYRKQKRDIIESLKG